jgi:hypothetical protein
MRDVILEAKAGDGRLTVDLRSPVATRVQPASTIVGTAGEEQVQRSAQHLARLDSSPAADLRSPSNRTADGAGLGVAPRNDRTSQGGIRREEAALLTRS